MKEDRSPTPSGSGAPPGAGALGAAPSRSPGSSRPEAELARGLGALLRRDESGHRREAVEEDDENRLLDLVAGRLDAEEAHDLSRRLREEPALRTVYEEIRSAVADLGPADAVPPETSREGSRTPVAGARRRLLPRAAVWLAAAAVATVVLLTSDRGLLQERTETGEHSQVSALAAAWNDEVSRLRSRRGFDLPEDPLGLRARSGPLLADPVADEGAGPAPLHPSGGRERGPRVPFSWRAVPNASRYRVEVFDHAFTPVVEATVERASWETGELPRGRLLLWQVTAELAGGARVTAPTPPAPEARFALITADQKTRLDTREAEVVELERSGGLDAGGALLARCVALVDVGLLREARLLLEAASEEDLQRDLRRDLLASLAP